MKMEGKYILDEHNKPVEISNLIDWAKWMETSSRILAKTHLEVENEDVLISTVFLGLDHSYGEGPPVLFETMVFGGIYDEEQERYETYDEAIEGHEAWTKRVEVTGSSLGPSPA